jgi:ABC-2 type transport system permease protein
MPLMRFTGIIKNKDRFRYIASIIAIGIGVGLQFGIRRFVEGNLDQSRLETTLADLERNVSAATSFFPSAKYSAISLIRSMEPSGFINMIFYLGLSAIVMAVFLYLSQILYFKGVMGISETGSKRRAMSKSELVRTTEKKSAMFTYFLKEIRIILRTPSFFINCILANFIWPVIIMISNFTNSNNGMSLPELGNTIRQNGDNGLILAVGFAVSLFLSSSNSVTSTAISREGQNLYFNKYIPMRYDKQILMKVMSGVAIGTFGYIITLIVISILIKLNIYTIILLILVGLFGVTFSSFTGIIFDLINPKLNWDNEQKAVKQNLNVIFNMIASIIFAAVFVILIYITGLTVIETLIAVILIFGMFDAILFYLVSTVGVKLFKRIEV